MSKTKAEQPAEKQFSLKPIEIQMIQNMHDRANSAMFDYFSFIAIERLAYTPTKDTRFRVEQGKLFISEVPIPEQPKEEVSVG
jgi:hypothetical protein